MLPAYTIYQKIVSCRIEEPLSFLKQSVWMTKALLRSNWMLVKLMVMMTQQFLELFFLSQELMYKNKLKQP